MQYIEADNFSGKSTSIRHHTGLLTDRICLFDFLSVYNSLIIPIENRFFDFYPLGATIYFR